MVLGRVWFLRADLCALFLFPVRWQTRGWVTPVLEPQHFQHRQPQARPAPSPSRQQKEASEEEQALSNFKADGLSGTADGKAPTPPQLPKTVAGQRSRSLKSNSHSSHLSHCLSSEPQTPGMQVTACAFCLQGGARGPPLCPQSSRLPNHISSYLLTAAAGSMVTLVAQFPHSPGQVVWSCPTSTSWACVSAPAKLCPAVFLQKDQKPPM